MSLQSQKPQNSDFMIEEAIKQGKQQAAETKPLSEVTFRFSETQEKMLTELTTALGLSAKTTVQSAIKFVQFYAERKKVPDLKKLKDYPVKLEGEPRLKFNLTAETSSKLEDLGMAEYPNECAVLGIQLLYNSLIEGL